MIMWLSEMRGTSMTSALFTVKLVQIWSIWPPRLWVAIPLPTVGLSPASFRNCRSYWNWLTSPITIIFEFLSFSRIRWFTIQRRFLMVSLETSTSLGGRYMLITWTSVLSKVAIDQTSVLPRCLMHFVSCKFLNTCSTPPFEFPPV